MKLKSLIVCYCTVLGNFTVGAVNGVGASVRVPRRTFFNGVPLFDGAVEMNTRQCLAIIERRIANVRDTIGNGHTRQRGASIERITANARDAIRNHKFSNQIAVEIQIVCIVQRIGSGITEFDIAPSCQIGNMNTHQRGAPRERITANTRNAIGDGDTRQSLAIMECHISNARDAIGNGDTRQRGAPRERRITNARDAIGDGDICQRGASIERIIANACDTLWNDTAVTTLN